MRHVTTLLWVAFLSSKVSFAAELTTTSTQQSAMAAVAAVTTASCAVAVIAADPDSRHSFENCFGQGIADPCASTLRQTINTMMPMVIPSLTRGFASTLRHGSAREAPYLTYCKGMVMSALVQVMYIQMVDWRSLILSVCGVADMLVVINNLTIFPTTADGIDSVVSLVRSVLCAYALCELWDCEMI